MKKYLLRLISKWYLENIFTNQKYLIYMYKQDLELNNPAGLICHKTQPTSLLTISVRSKYLKSYGQVEQQYSTFDMFSPPFWITIFSLLTLVGLFVRITKSYWILLFHSFRQILVCAYTGVLYCLHSSLWISFPTQSYLLLYSSWVNLLYYTYYYYHYYFFLPFLSFFTPVLTGAFSLKSEFQGLFLVFYLFLSLLWSGQSQFYF